MKISKIEYQKDPNRVNIFVDEIFTIGIEDELRYKFKLEVGMEVDDDFIKSILDAEETNKAINQALNLLSYRQRSEKEIYLALKRKDYQESSIMKAIDYCRKNKYLDDKAFAKSYVNDKINLSKLGVERIRYELRLKGISQEIIDRVLVVDKDDQYELAKELAEKRIKSYKNDSTNAIYRKLGGYLQRRGYSYEIISRVLRDLLKE